MASSLSYRSLVSSSLSANDATPTHRKKLSSADGVHDSKLFVGKFTEKLMAVLSRDDTDHAIFWLADGMSFKIVDKDVLTTDILPHFFKESKYSSFNRRLQRWGFQRKLDCGKGVIYHHKLFLRDKPHMCKFMCSFYTAKKQKRQNELRNDSTERNLSPHSPLNVMNQHPVQGSYQAPPLNSITYPENTFQESYQDSQLNLFQPAVPKVTSSQYLQEFLNNMEHQQSALQTQQHQKNCMTNQHLNKEFLNSQMQQLLENEQMQNLAHDSSEFFRIRHTFKHQQTQAQLDKLQKCFITTQQLYQQVSHQIKKQDYLLSTLIKR